MAGRIPLARFFAVAVGALIVFAAGVVGGIANGNAGDPLILGIGNSAGPASTQMSSSSEGDAFAVSSTGEGTQANAIRARARNGTAGAFTSENNNAVFARVTRGDRFAIIADNGGDVGPGGAILANGHANPALVAEVDDQSVDPIRVNSSSLVDGLNADLLDGQHAVDLVPGGTVPEGTTITGVWAIRSSEAGTAWESVSFGFVLRDAPAVHYVPAEGPDIEGCPGTAADPQASPGHLCVYEALAANVGGEGCVGSPVTEECGVGNENGFIVARQSEMEGEWHAVGTWAVAQPEAGPSGGDDSGDGRTILDP